MQKIEVNNWKNIKKKGRKNGEDNISTKAKT